MATQRYVKYRGLPSRLFTVGRNSEKKIKSNHYSGDHHVRHNYKSRGLFKDYVLWYVKDCECEWETTSCDTFGHVMEVGQLLWHVLVLDGGGIFQEARLLQGALVASPVLRGWQSPGQEPEGHSGGQGDDPCDQVAQPPGAHPPCITGCDCDGLCEGMLGV